MLHASTPQQFHSQPVHTIRSSVIPNGIGPLMS